MDWYGNDGRSSPYPGVVQIATCGICGTEMSVERNVLGPTSKTEARGGGEHLHDSFTCPHLSAGWHKRVVKLKYEHRSTESRSIQKILEQEMFEILRTKEAPE